ncbi:hypothetical protein [Variovorax sp. PCZ-1]|uniref:hypothetical protein n=1 Tax=Variovorax sp. PCZ-1 TaxID=2835533 RepID=UPI001BCBB35E|nr:hypothetical protein [Variovorax sp. PCZ-1]MBS7808922.1 hypothetical protein [Variovorax sp. PCZ-1]
MINLKMQSDLWETMWSARQAVQYFLLDDKQMREDGVLARRINSRLDSWFDGAKGALLQDEVLREEVPNLSHILSRLDEHMLERKLTRELLFPPPLWMRLFKELQFPIQAHAMNELKLWQLRNEAKGRYFLYKYWNEKRQNYIGPKHEPTGKHGRTALELANGDLPDKLTKMVLALNWIVEAYAGFKVKTKIKPVPDGKVTPRKSKRNLQEVEAIQKAIASKPSKPGKRRNIKALRTQYGTGCVDAVEQALEHCVERRKSNVIKGSSDNRPYSTSLSPLALIEHLQGRYRTVARYAVSTLKPVLGHFVQTPRGRPPTLAELSEREFQAAKKSQRKSR